MPFWYVTVEPIAPGLKQLLGKACILSAGPYNIENLYVEAFAVYTNKTMTGAMGVRQLPPGVLRS